MNPIVKPVDDKHVEYVLEPTDLELIKKVKVIGTLGELEELILHQMCIMQLVSLVTHESHRDLDETKRLVREHGGAHLVPIGELDSEPFKGLSDYPICVSPIITSRMIDLNDYRTSQAQRTKMKQLIPEILNTCPVRRLKSGVEKRHETAAFKRAERRREAILNAVPPGAPFSQQVAAIREAAAIR